MTLAEADAVQRALPAAPLVPMRERVHADLDWGGTGPPSPTPRPAATSFDEYAPAFCSAFQALFRAVGNPDTAADSELSKALDDAVAAGDAASADEVAAKVMSELETGRQHAAFARGWTPAAPMMAHMDWVFIAFEAMTEAKRTAAKAPGSVDPQAVLEQAGGVDAWIALLTAWPTIAERPDGVQPCADVPISP